MRAKKMHRRSFLRGVGTVAIALPFLEEMTLGHALGAEDEVPERLVTLFFGLGLDPSWQNDFEGPLEPYRPFADKMAMCSVNLGQGSEGGAHCNTSTVVFVGEEQRGVDIAGGPSLDQLVRAELDPAAPTLTSGLWWRRGACDAQANRVYNPDGSPRSPIKRPSDVFDRLFGSLPAEDEPEPDTEQARRRRRVRRSVLDTVMDQYRHLRGEASYLGKESKQKIEQHLSSIREIETELAPADDAIDEAEDPSGSCVAPERPADPAIADYDRFTYGTGDSAPEIAWEDFQQVYRLHARLWATALKCDLVRYGNLMFESAGGHTNLRGTYSALGESTDFPGSSQHDSYFHDNQPRHARLYQHFAQSNLAYFLGLLDGSDAVEANGKTVLENTCIVIGTEYGWNHDKNHAFHAVVGGRGRFRSGFFTDREMNCIDLYNAILTGYGIEPSVGSRTGVSSEGDGSVLLA